jgi:hypothetical protein
MSEPDRITVHSTSMIDAHLQPPPAGTRVFALNRGGVIVQTVWKSNSIDDFDAWHPYLKVPDTVRKRQSERYQPKEQT